MKVDLPPTDVTRFAHVLSSTLYERLERDYKWALHLALLAILSVPKKTNSQFGDLAHRLAYFFGDGKPDLVALGVSPDDLAFIMGSPQRRPRWAVDFLLGGRHAFMQYKWIPVAVKRGYAKRITDAFSELLYASAPLEQRIHGFRSKLGDLKEQLARSGVIPASPGHYKPSLPFVAVLLAGADPKRYALYNARAVTYGLRQYAGKPGFASNSVEQRYLEALDLLESIYREFEDHKLAPQDLFDVQSFLWIASHDYWDDYNEPEVEETLAVIERASTAGYLADPVLRKAIEEHAVHQVIDHFKRAGWTKITPRGKPYDLLCERAGSSERLYVEVKGSQSAAQSVILTRNEVKHARTHYPHTALAVVSEIEVIGKPPRCGNGKIKVYQPWQPERAALTCMAFSYARDLAARQKKLALD